MAFDLASVVNPKTTAILCMEMQRGIVGDLSGIPALVSAVREAGMVDHTARLLAAARRAGVAVVFCTHECRPDGKGSTHNTPMQARALKSGGGASTVIGTPGAQVLPELARTEADLAVPRSHGMSPFTGTSLDALLRSLGITTVIATGVSLNVGVMGMAIEAVGLGYTVVVPRDCVAGTPTEYAEAVLKNALPVIANVTTSETLIACWQ